VPELFARDGEAAFRRPRPTRSGAPAPHRAGRGLGGRRRRPAPGEPDLLRASGRVVWLRARPRPWPPGSATGPGAPPRRGPRGRADRARCRPPPALRRGGGRDDRRGRPRPGRGGGADRRRTPGDGASPGGEPDAGDPGRARLPLLPGPHRRGARHELARFVPPTAKRPSWSPRRRGEGRLAGRTSTPACPSRSAPSPRGRRARRWPRWRSCAAGSPGRASPGPTWWSPWGRHRHRRGRVRRGHLPPGHGVREHRHHAAGPGRRRHRGQDRGQPARGEEPRRRLLAAPRRAVRHRDPRHAAAPRVGLRRGEMAKYAFLGGAAPTPGPADRRAGGALRGIKARWWRPTSARATAA
jgi:hypothetical protein